MMKKHMMSLISMGVVGVLALTGCTSEMAEDDKLGNAEAGEVVEVEGQQDQYGWFPHMRLTFDGDILTEVYFDSVNDAGSKKSQDEEYNSTMKEKTGMSAKEAMETLRLQLLEEQEAEAVDIVTGATQTSTEFKDMAAQALAQYRNGENSANNYNNGDPTTNTDDTKEGPANEEGDVTYENGGDGSPNSPENAENEEDASSGEGEGEGESSGQTNE